MTPAAFRISIGMDEKQVRERFAAASIELRQGEKEGELVADYEDGKTITVHFSDGRLDSVRFELIDFLPVIPQHWKTLSERLRAELGQPDISPAGTDVLIWQDRSPNVIAALSTRRDNDFGKQGLGYAVVRYFEPPPAAARTEGEGAAEGR